MVNPIFNINDAFDHSPKSDVIVESETITDEKKVFAQNVNQSQNEFGYFWSSAGITLDRTTENKTANSVANYVFENILEDRSLITDHTTEGDYFIADRINYTQNTKQVGTELHKGVFYFMPKFNNLSTNVVFKLFENNALPLKKLSSSGQAIDLQANDIIAQRVHIIVYDYINNEPCFLLYNLLTDELIKNISGKYVVEEILNMTTESPTEPKVGDFYLNTAAGTIYNGFVGETGTTVIDNTIYYIYRIDNSGTPYYQAVNLSYGDTIYDKSQDRNWYYSSSGEIKEIGQKNSWYIGQIIQSILPIDDATCHLADGSILSIDGMYSDFFQYLLTLQTDYPNIFTTESGWQSVNSLYGQCPKFVVNNSQVQYYCYKDSTNSYYVRYTDNNKYQVVYKYENQQISTAGVYGTTYISDEDVYTLTIGDTVYSRSTSDDVAVLQPVSVRLPKLTKYIKGASSLQDLGQIQPEGLPNHAHTRGSMNITGGIGLNNGSFGPIRNSGDYSGAFYSSSNKYTGPLGESNQTGTGFGFDASRAWTGATSNASESNSIYGATANVEVNSAKLAYYIVLAQYQKTDIQVDLTQKADTDLSNLTSVGQSKLGGMQYIGQIIAVDATGNYIPEGCLPCDGQTYDSASFPLLWTNYLVGGLLNSSDMATYNNYLTTYGNVSFFGIDTTNNTFRVPYISDGTFIQQSQTNNEIGSHYNPGLPNITGLTGEGSRAPYSVGATGSFYDTGTARVDWDGSGTANGYSRIGFNASLSNPIYGASSTVQPKSVGYRYFVVVANGAINQSYIDYSTVCFKDGSNATFANLSQTAKSNIAKLNTPNYNSGILISSRISYTTPAYGVIIGLVGPGNVDPTHNVQAIGLYADQNRTVRLAGITFDDLTTSLYNSFCVPVEKNKTYYLDGQNGICIFFPYYQ